MREICGEDTKIMEAVHSPCLFEKEHKGVHKHEEICNSFSCFCMGIRKRMSAIHLMDWEELTKEIGKLDMKRSKIKQRYTVNI